MQAIREEIEKPTKRKAMDQFCGRLILWDMRPHQDRLITLATDYYQARLNLSKPNEPKPHLPPVQDSQRLSRSVAAINKTIGNFSKSWGIKEQPLDK